MGGWDVLYEGQQSEPAGSRSILLGARADLTLVSSRLYIWGPAEGGVSTELVLRTRGAGGDTAPNVGAALSGNAAGAAGTAGAVILVRTGCVTNRPGAEVRLDLTAPMSAYRASSVAAAPLQSAALTLGADVRLDELGLQPNLSGGASIRRTTFLSERLWVAQLRAKSPGA